jgi:pyruvate,water dikinase
VVNADRVGGKAAGLARLAELGLPVPPSIVLAVDEELDDPTDVVARLGEPLAVRSSAVGEDGTERSAAGQYESVLDVRASGLLEAVAHVRSSTTRAQAYGAEGGVAVVVQRQVPATRAGVAFSRDPISGADEIVIECALGGGEAIVSGRVTPDRYRVTGCRVRARASGSVRTLRNDEALAIAELVRRAEAGFARPVDVEFCLEGRDIWLVQCRPITTL